MKTTARFAARTLAWLLTAASALAGDPVFDVQALLATPLDPRVLKSSEKDGIVTEEVKFHSETDNGANVEIFAYFSYPKGAEKLPAFIWNQSGLARASTHFTDLGARRGYAAMCIDFPIPGYRSTGNYPINQGMVLTDDPRKAPIYHGAVALLKAVSFLESRKEVDKDRIGMCGASWGGFFTTLMAGIDPRLKAASAMFGTGNLQLGNVWWDDGTKAAPDAAYRERWRTTLDPALRLPKSRAAISWVSGANDNFFWMPSVMATYEAAPVPRNLTVLPNWDHGVPPALDEQVFAWLDAQLKGAPAFITVSPLKVEKKQDGDLMAKWDFKGPRNAKTADLMLSYGKAGNWQSRYWITVPAAISGNQCSATLPASSLPFHVSGAVTDTNSFRYSTPLLAVDPADHGIKGGGIPDYDGCSEWGGFEPSQVHYLKGLAHMNPAVTNVAHQGGQSLIVRNSTTVTPIYFTAGIPHRLALFMKADREADVKVELKGQFDGKAQNSDRTVHVGKDWKEYTMDYTPPEMLAGRLKAMVTVPAETTVLLDTVSFRPVRP